METLFNIYQDYIVRIAQVDAAEEKAKIIYDAVAAYDQDLADDMDSVMGIMAYAYEMQGFFSGLELAPIIEERAKAAKAKAARGR